MKKAIHTILTLGASLYVSFVAVISFLSTMGMCGMKEGALMYGISFVCMLYLLTFLWVNSPSQKGR